MKTVLITGVCGGIGWQTARTFLEAGWGVVGIDLEASLPTGDDVRYLQGDVSSPDFWEQHVLPALSVHEGLDAVVNNAAVQVVKPLQETSLVEWERVMQVNLRGPFLSMKYLVPLLAKRKGSVVNVASVHALATSPGNAAYAASKGGLTALTRASALDLADMGIRVNSVLPGAVDTPMLVQGLSRGLSGDSEQEVAALKTTLSEKTPCRRIGLPQEIANMIFFLSNSELSSFVNGQNMVVDGGALCRLCTE